MRRPVLHKYEIFKSDLSLNELRDSVTQTEHSYFYTGRIYSRQTDNKQAANLYFAGAAPGSIDIKLLVRVEQTKYVCAPRLHIKT